MSWRYASAFSGDAIRNVGSDTTTRTGTNDMSLRATTSQVL
jgi:hypothetical protein